jgi:NAD(P)-dependent dehydrogenase (short-subunit alcohol dehydrogenase family)
LSAAESQFDFDFKERSLEGRVILVAGGTGGLGSATVALLARDGATLVVGYRKDKDKAQALKQAVEARFKASIHLVEGDIGEAETRARYVDAAEHLGAGVYALVCFTGDPARVKFDEATDSDLHASMQENYIAPVLLARDVAHRCQARRQEGAIVLFSTMQAVAVFESSINYAAPKTALIQAAKIMAKQWGGPAGVRVNVIAPGVNRAGMALQSIESGKYDFFLEQNIIPRFGRPEDIARAVRLLVEPDNYITGQVITVDGGLTLRRDK